MPTYRLHAHDGDDLGLLEHPAPNVEPGDIVMFRGRARGARDGARRGAAGTRWRRCLRSFPGRLY
jgi:hypothetical protein